MLGFGRDALHVPVSENSGLHAAYRSGQSFRGYFATALTIALMIVFTLDSFQKGGPPWILPL